jgi:hypothetical protein
MQLYEIYILVLCFWCVCRGTLTPEKVPGCTLPAVTRLSCAPIVRYLMNKYPTCLNLITDVCQIREDSRCCELKRLIQIARGGNKEAKSKGCSDERIDTIQEFGDLTSCEF